VSKHAAIDHRKRGHLLQIIQAPFATGLTARDQEQNEKAPAARPRSQPNSSTIGPALSLPGNISEKGGCATSRPARR